MSSWGSLLSLVFALGSATTSPSLDLDRKVADLLIPVQPEEETRQTPAYRKRGSRGHCPKWCPQKGAAEAACWGESIVDLTRPVLTYTYTIFFLFVVVLAFVCLFLFMKRGGSVFLLLVLAGPYPVA